MKMLSEQARHDRHISCATCATHRRPENVPWQQHAIGCPTRGRLFDAVQVSTFGVPTRVHGTHSF